MKNFGAFNRVPLDIWDWAGAVLPVGAPNGQMLWSRIRRLFYTYEFIQALGRSLWLGDQVERFDVPCNGAATARSATTASVSLGTPGASPKYDLLLEDFFVSYQFSGGTTNGGANHWDLKLTKYVNVTQTILATYNTAQDGSSANIFGRYTAVTPQLLGVGAGLIAIDITKNSAPSNIIVYAAHFAGRVVG